MPNNLKVMHIVGAKGPGGAETFFVRLVKAFAEGDFPVDIIPVVRAKSWIAERLEEAGILHKTAPFGGWWDKRISGRTTALLQQYIADEQPQVIQTWMNRASGFLPAVDVPTVGRLGGYYDVGYYKKLNHLIGNTEDICAYLKAQGLPEENVHYVPNFTKMPPPDFKDSRFEVRDRANVPQDAFVVLLAGRLHPNKGFDTALYALNHLPNVHALVVGQGDQESALRAMVEADKLTKRVHFMGWTNNITPYAAAADAWLVPSRHEPLGNTILDAWAHEIPLVASMTAGPRSLIEDGANGLLVPAEDADALVTAVECLQGDEKLCTQLVAAGLKKYQKNFSQAVVLKQYTELYRQLARKA